MGSSGNILLLGLEATLYFVVMAGLFRARHRFGIGLVFCALGTMHFLETYLAAILYLDIGGGFIISPGSVVLFSGKLVVLLLVYIREDAAAVRQPIYGLLVGNFLMVALVALMRFHEVVPSIDDRAPDFRLMDEMGGLMIWGTILLFIDCILIILLYERSAAWLRHRQTARIVLSAAAILTFDQVGFFTVLHVFLGAPVSAFFGGWFAKLVAAVFYGALAGLYLRYMEHAVGRGRVKLADVFDTLTYRQRYEALLAQSGHDSLTGLLDRGRFDRDGAGAIANADVSGRPMSLIVVDIDHFKDFNDRYGHTVGDEVIRRIAREIASGVREHDRVYRYGGEEFVVLAEGLPHFAAMATAERIRQRISRAVVPGIAGTVTASIGVSTTPDDGRDIARLFRIADERLYAAKGAGRNRVSGRDQADAAPAYRESA